MRVLIASFFPRSIYLEGIHILIDSLATSLSAQGIETTVLAPLGSLPARPRYAVVDYLSGANGSVLAIFRRFASTLREISGRFDVVQLVDLTPSFLPVTERMLSQPHRTLDLIVGPVLSWTDLRSQRLSRQSLIHWITKNAGWVRLAKGSCRKYVVSSEFQRRQLLDLGLPQEKVCVLPFGIHPQRVHIQDKDAARQALGVEGEQVIGYIGHFSPLKGVPDLLCAFEQLALAHPEMTLVLAWSGKGIESRKILGQIESSPVQSHIQLLGKVDVAQFMAACDVIALPFLGSSIPHFPVVLLEAFGSRTPVVTTRVGGVPEVVVDGETGMLASPGNPVELARALTQILDDELLRQRIIVQAERAFQERFNSDAVAVRYIELYQEVIA